MGGLVKERKNKARSDLVPIGIKIISIYYYFLAGISIFVVFFIGQIIGAQVLAIGLILSLILIAGGVLDVFIGINLWKGKNWAKILVIIFSVLFFIEESYGFIIKKSLEDLFLLVVNLIILLYLLFSRKVKNFFQNN